MPLPITRGAASAKGFGFTQGGFAGWWPIGTTFTFETTGLTGPIGPSNYQFSLLYGSQLFYTLGYFNSSSGIQILSNVPAGSYRVTLAGAQGNDPDNNSGTGGYGAIIECDYVIAEGSEIRMIAGQRGVKVAGGQPSSQPGGGASSFWVGTSASSATQYGIAGGGGGSYNGGTGFDAAGNLTGMNSDAENTGNGGQSTDYSSGGAGWFQNAPNTTANTGIVAKAPFNGGNGFIYSNPGGSGGFGGGGGQTNSGGNRAGAGGGYTGGWGKNAPANLDPGGSGGGGNKFVGGTYGGTYKNPRTGAGYIQILRLG